MSEKISENGRELLKIVAVSVENPNQALQFKKTCARYGMAVNKEGRDIFPRYEAFKITSFGVFAYPLSDQDLLNQADITKKILSVKNFASVLAGGKAV